VKEPFKNMKSPHVIAVAGKGGVGKSIITTLLAKVLSENDKYKLLLIDADPTYPHLSIMLNLKPKKSVERIRSELIQKTLQKEKVVKEIAENIDFDVYNAIEESKSFSLLSIGQPENSGCFCPSNTLLRKVIESISKDFDIVIIDCEAGLEQISRKVIESIDYLMIITDISLRSVDTAVSISKIGKKFTKAEKIGVIINKSEGDISNIVNQIKSNGLDLIGIIPRDPRISELDLNAKPIILIEQENRSYQKVKEMLSKILSIN
jgi:CO dehydrogenase maturation factor